MPQPLTVAPGQRLHRCHHAEPTGGGIAKKIFLLRIAVGLVGQLDCLRE